MAKKPDQRYQSARELATAARRALTGQPTPTRDAHTAPTVRLDDATRPAARQRPPTPETATPPPPWGHRQRRQALIAAIAAIAVILVAVITFQLLQPHSPASQTPTAGPTAQPAPPSSVVPSATAPSAAVPGLAAFVGVWQAHTERLVIDSTGTGRLTYGANTEDFTLASVSNGVASGSVTASSDSRYPVGAPVTATLAAVLPGQLLQLTINGSELLPFCDNAAEAAGQCGA